MFSRFVHSNGVGWGLSFSAGFAFGYHFVPFDEIRTKARKATSAWRRSRRQPPTPEPAVDTSSVHPLLASACEQESSAWWRRYPRHTDRSAASGNKLRPAANNWGGKSLLPNSPFRRSHRVHGDIPAKHDTESLNPSTTIRRIPENALQMTDDTTRANNLYSHDIQHTYEINDDDTTEILQQSNYGAQITRLPPLHGQQANDNVTIICRSPELFTVNLPDDTSLWHLISDREFSVTINNPTRLCSPYDDQAVDNIQRDLASISVPLAKVYVGVTPGCEDPAYAGQLINNILCVLQGYSLRPDEFTVQLPLDHVRFLSSDGGFAHLQPREHQPMLIFEYAADSVLQDAVVPSHALLQSLKVIPQLVPWWRHGRIDIHQLRHLTLSYPLPVDDFIELLSQSKNLEKVNVGWLLQSRSTKPMDSSQAVMLEELTSLTLLSAVGLGAFFDSVSMPNLRRLTLSISGAADLDAYNMFWEELEEVEIRCRMTDEEEGRLRHRCIKAVQQKNFKCNL